MTLEYADTTIKSDATHHTASLLIPEANVWLLSWTPGMFRFRQAEDAILLAEAVGQIVPLNGGNDAWRRIDEYAEQLGMSGTDAMLRVVVADRHSQSIRAAKRCLQQYPPSCFNYRYGKRNFADKKGVGDDHNGRRSVHEAQRPTRGRLGPSR